MRIKDNCKTIAIYEKDLDVQRMISFDDFLVFAKEDNLGNGTQLFINEKYLKGVI